MAVINTNVQQLSGATVESAHTLSGQLRTDVTVINDPEAIPANNTVYTFYVKNTGKTTLATDLVTVMIDGAIVPTGNVSVTVLGGASEWGPADVIRIEADPGYSLASGRHRVRVTVENGVSDTLDFEV